MHGRCNYVDEDEDTVRHGGLDDHTDDGIIGARIIFSHRRLHLASYGEETFRHENGIKHSVHHLDGEICKCGFDIVEQIPGTRLDQDGDGYCCSRCQ
jgi:hypothetical protein